MVLVLKIRLLLWKNFLLRRRNKFRFIAELVYPLLLFVPLLVNKPASLTVHTPECHYMDIALPSSGQLPFLHSLINDTRNSCHGPKQTQTHEQRKTRGKKYRHKTVDAHEPQACQEIKDFITKDGGAMKWDLLKPYLRGKVMYYPDTDTTRAIMMGVNETLNKISAPIHLEDDAMQVLRSALGNEVIDFISGLVSDGSLSDPGLTTENRTAAGAFSTKNSRQPGPKVLRDFYALLEECVDTQKVQAVDPENALQIAWALQETNNLWALIVFEDADKPLLKYSIRMGADRLPGPERFISDHLSAGSDASSLQRNKFISHGFLYLQDIIDEAVIAQRTNRTNCPGRIIRRFPSPATSTDNLRNLTAQLVPMMAALAWMYTFSQAVKSAVLEKEGRIKEVLAAMGLGRGVQWAGWMLEGLCCTLCTCTLLAVILKLGGVTEHSDVLVVLLLLASHAVAMLSLALLLASLFSRAVVAGPAAGIVYFLTYLAYQLVRSQAGEGRWAMLGGLVSTVALAQGAAVISAAEERGEGAQWTNIHVPLGPREPCTVAACVALLWVDAALYALLTWYIDAVFPGEYGVPKGYLFFLSKSYWLGIPTAGECDVLRATVRNRRESISGTTESEPQGAVIGVAIDNLSKVFGKDVAVDGLTLNLCQNQITCLLGHNGSGKTTVLSVLMGLYTPSAGTAYVNGLDIRTDMDLIRTGMGVCPQHNMLFNSLTVEEHLLFFGRIKAVPEPILRAEIDEMLNMMGLQHKRGAFPGALSGGMQRKLSVAMAFSGRSSVVLLDEPTAGVDPCSRRGIWDLLARLRIENLQVFAR